jgi:hypothetical protein
MYVCICECIYTSIVSYVHMYVCMHIRLICMHFRKTSAYDLHLCICDLYACIYACMHARSILINVCIHPCQFENAQTAKHVWTKHKLVHQIYILNQPHIYYCTQSRSLLGRASPKFEADSQALKILPFLPLSSHWECIPLISNR